MHYYTALQSVLQFSILLQLISAPAFLLWHANAWFVRRRSSRLDRSHSENTWSSVGSGLLFHTECVILIHLLSTRKSYHCGPQWAISHVLAVVNKTRCQAQYEPCVLGRHTGVLFYFHETASWNLSRPFFHNSMCGFSIIEYGEWWLWVVVLSPSRV